MASRCGQFPLINIDKLTNRIREVKISKRNTVRLQNCERRAAWNVQYGIPREDYIEYESESSGTKFHNYSQEMLVNNNNFTSDEDIERFNKISENEEVDKREKLFSKYRELIEKLKPYSNLSITKSEFNLGFTIVADVRGLKNGEVVDKKVASVFMGRADLVGRVDGTPIIIELKTRPELPEDFLEAQLYALGASRLLNVNEIKILHIYLPDEDSSVKERIFSESELVEAEKKYESLAIKSASWVPFNALSPAYNIGDWCEFCEFKSTCLENR